MKKILIIITALMVILSCATTKEAKLSRIELRNEKKIVEQALIKNAVESRRFIIKLDKLYFSYGGFADLIPRANYMIIDGEKAIISAAYLGRQYNIRGIAGINMFGKAMNYELTSDLTRGSYDIKMKVNNGNVSFDVYLTISKNGFCSASVSGLKIDYIRYSGHIVAMKDKTNTPLPEGNVI